MTYEDILAAMQQRYRELAGFEADSASDIGIRLRVLAAQLEQQHRAVQSLALEVFPQTSTGEYLERHAETRGLARKGAVHAQGTLLFSREIPAGADLTVAAGIVCATRPEPQIQFVTTADATLPAGETAVEVPARAVQPGANGNVAPGAVGAMVSLAPGLTAVDNPAAFAGGVDEESDDALRERLLASYHNIANGTNAAFYYDKAMGWEGVASAAVLPRARGRGTVDVVISCGGAAPPEAVEAGLQRELERCREVNVDVQVRCATQRKATVVALLTEEEGYDFADVAERCLLALRQHVLDLGVGRPLLLAHLTRCALAQEGVANVRFESPLTDLLPGPAEVLRPSGTTVRRMVTA